MEKKERKKRLHSFIFRLRVSLCFRTNANAEIRATQTEREREGRVANTSSSFCGLVRETRAFCLRKGNSKERERSSF